MSCVRRQCRRRRFLQVGTIHLDTVRCRYNAVNFLTNIHKRHLIVRPLVGFVLHFRNVENILACTNTSFEQHCGSTTSVAGEIFTDAVIVSSRKSLYEQGTDYSNCPVLANGTSWATCQIRKTVGCACATHSFHRHPDMHHGTCVTHVPWCMPGSLTIGFLWSRWRGKRSRHSRRMRNPQFYVSGQRPIQSSSRISILLTDQSHKGHNAPVTCPTIHHAMHISVPQSALWDMGQEHCGICETGLLCRQWWPHNIWSVIFNGRHQAIICSLVESLSSGPFQWKWTHSRKNSVEGRF